MTDIATQPPKRDARTEFSVQESMSGKLVLRVRDFDGDYPSSGQWRDATSADLPYFFYRVNGK